MASKLSGRQWRGVAIVVVVLSSPFVSHCEKPKQEQAAPARAAPAPAPLTPEQRAAAAEGEARRKATEARIQAALDAAVARLAVPEAVKAKEEAALPLAEKLQCDVEATTWLTERLGGNPNEDRYSGQMTVTISTTGSKVIPAGRVVGVRVIKGDPKDENALPLDFEMTAQLWRGEQSKRPQGTNTLDNSDSGSWRMVRDQRGYNSIILENLLIDRNTGTLDYESVTRSTYVFQTKIHGPCKKPTQRKTRPASSSR